MSDMSGLRLLGCTNLPSMLTLDLRYQASKPCHRPSNP
jgi:hypothetical protein